jgi:hypothetical protein
MGERTGSLVFFDLWPYVKGRVMLFAYVVVILAVLSNLADKAENLFHLSPLQTEKTALEIPRPIQCCSGLLPQANQKRNRMSFSC